MLRVIMYVVAALVSLCEVHMDSAIRLLCRFFAVGCRIPIAIGTSGTQVNPSRATQIHHDLVCSIASITPTNLASVHLCICSVVE